MQKKGLIELFVLRWTLPYRFNPFLTAIRKHSIVNAVFCNLKEGKYSETGKNILYPWIRRYSRKSF